MALQEYTSLKSTELHILKDWDGAASVQPTKEYYFLLKGVETVIGKHCRGCAKTNGSSHRFQLSNSSMLVQSFCLMPTARMNLLLLN